MNGYFGDLHGVCREKWARLDRALLAAGAGALFANDLASVRYLTGYLPYLTLSPALGQPALYIVGQERPILYPVSFYADFARTRFPWIEVRPLPGDLAGEVAALWRAQAPPGTRLACSGLTPPLERALVAAAGAEALLPAEALLADARAVKTPGEIALLRDAVRIAELGMAAALAALGAGRSECEVCAVAEAAMRREGTESHAIVLRGGNAAILQEVSSDDRFAADDLALIDLGCYRRGYRAEYARSRGLSPLSARQRALLAAVSGAVAAAATLLRPGVTCGAVARAAAGAIAAAGYGEFVHRYPVGHGLGVTGSEYPLLLPGSEVRLEAGMVINLEPGIFIPDEAVGIRTEDIFLITPDGPELLTPSVPHIA